MMKSPTTTRTIVTIRPTISARSSAISRSSPLHFLHNEGIPLNARDLHAIAGPDGLAGDCRQEGAPPRVRDDEDLPPRPRRRRNRDLPRHADEVDHLVLGLALALREQLHEDPEDDPGEEGGHPSREERDHDRGERLRDLEERTERPEERSEREQDRKG